MNDRIPSFDPTRSLSALIRVPVYVEDRETAVYLENLLPQMATRFEFKTASGIYGVASRIATDRSNHPNTMVFGIRDRDYAQNPNTELCIDKPTFVLRKFEIENYCLDWAAISEFSKERLGREFSAEKIGLFALGYARDILYAVAHNAIVASLDLNVNCTLSPAVRIYPKPYSTLDASERERTVVDRGGVANRLRSCRLLTDPFKLEDALIDESIARFAEAVDSPDAMWMDLFPGKEILRAIGHTLLNLPAPLYLSLIAFVANYQRKHQAVPEDLDFFAQQVFELTK